MTAEMIAKKNVLVVVRNDLTLYNEKYTAST
jgi:hypothetical protein